MIGIWRALAVKVQPKNLDALGHLVEKGGQGIFSCYSHLLTDLTNKGPPDWLFNDNSDQTSIRRREQVLCSCFTDISVKLLWQRLGKVLAVLETHALLINL